MINDLSPDAVEFGVQARRAFQSAGGDALVQQAESQPRSRAKVEPLLADLGAWDLNPLGGSDELEACAALCRSAGYWALPYPVAERLCRPDRSARQALVVARGESPVAPADGLDLTWVVMHLDGRCIRALPAAAGAPVRYRTFLTGLYPEARGRGEVETAERREVALALVLPCWTLLGMLDRAVDLTCSFVQDRHQFGQPLAAFQGVQFQLTDAEVERVGLEELAKYAVWSIEADRPQVVEDALALRLAALEAADVVFRVAHQLHGAIGFCDETPLSWISRYSGPIRRQPLDLSATRSELTRRLGNRPLEGIFS